jgi:hypothetical protein
MIEAVYDALTPIGRQSSLTVLFFCNGGYVAAARRIAMVLRDFASHLTFLVPSHCDSAGTIVALSGDEIVYTPLSIFSPVDPSLSGGSETADNEAISIQDIRLLPQAIHDWFGLALPEARERAFELLSGAIFPAALTAFYRSAQETVGICTELMGMRAEPGAPKLREDIARALTYGFGSHAYPLTGGDLQGLGLPARRTPELDDLARLAGRFIRDTIGPAASASDERWIDALIGTRDGILARHRATASRPRLAWETLSS